MKKILLAIDADHVDTEVIHFACNIATFTHSTLIGYFLGDAREEEPAANVAFVAQHNETVSTHCIPTVAERRQFAFIQQFERTCAVRGIRCQVLNNTKRNAAQAILEESRFADLVIVQPTLSFEKRLEEAPTALVKEILANAECPVMVAPSSVTGIEEIVFAYDGSRSAVFAIKQFTYLFPELADKKAIVLQVNKDDSLPVTEKEKLGKWLRMHYSSIGFQVLKGKASEELYGRLLGKQNTIVVMGAFGRSWLSGVFKPATAGLLLKTINLPFFITHH
ncbi:MAG TPA: hypothetical protein VGE79_12955 [Niastella sp.]